MRMRKTMLVLGISLFLSSCQSMESGSWFSTGAEAFEVYTLSDYQVQPQNDQACREIDSRATIAPGNSDYARRLQKIALMLGHNINGQPVDYNVYLSKEINAFAMENGCIRVYSGLMDLMNDNEMEAIIGHEIGHVALGHVKESRQIASGTNTMRTVASSVGGLAGSVSQSPLGDMGERLINSQFSQRQELEADEYSYDLLRKRGLNPTGLVTSFEKLAKLEVGQRNSMFDNHPVSAERAARIKDRMAADSIK
ncbi:M48 family metalloprotease [Trabulsiella odontotermitis]|uniref:Metalloprotease n=1 Tax=Trabulsiella odontotermitis TaxID=379893 RepID=A0A0L0H4R6_9ENTR|nr:M48 family metalloprotease [Trabulsiella odontotermitis]KNC90622.1 metalloprotease [Trabulsiella odontotermitis]KNC95708.1 metalloprotease [Trabulsiella odontotermitis]